MGALAGAEAGAGAAAVVGMVRTCPMRMRETSASEFAREIAATVVPELCAMWLTVSPERTV